MRVFSYQLQNNPVYRDFARNLGRDLTKISSCSEIPFLPIALFKTHAVTCFEPAQAEKVYQSSGTGGERSIHYVQSVEDYRISFSSAFERSYGAPSAYRILALLPHYLERGDSSLIDMARELMEKSGHAENGFFLDNTDDLIRTLDELNRKKERSILLGVSYALLDLAAKGPFGWPYTIIMETGGMKGKRRELTRMELHDRLRQCFGVASIHSEYGMTELLSQAYSHADGHFHCPPWMRVMPRDPNDPLSVTGFGKSCGLNIIDLANVQTCSFIATQDLGKVHEDGSFEVLGRFDNSDVRGCNLMVS